MAWEVCKAVLMLTYHTTKDYFRNMWSVLRDVAVITLRIVSSSMEETLDTEDITSDGSRFISSLCLRRTPKSKTDTKPFHTCGMPLPF